MKMRRSIWRKLTVVLFAILTVVSTWITVQNYTKVAKGSGLEFVDAHVEMTEVDGKAAYTVTFRVQNTLEKRLDVYLFSGTVTDGKGASAKFEASPAKSAIAKDDVQETTVTVIDSTGKTFTKLSKLTVILTNNKQYDLLGGEADKTAVPKDSVKALIAISIIFFGLFIYTCVLLYKSPKQKVHSKHRHHHHHHHHSSSTSSESSENSESSESSKS